MLPFILCCAVLEQFTASLPEPSFESFSVRLLSVVHTPQGELTALAQATFQAPDKYREEASMSFGNIVTVRNGDLSWGANPRGVLELNPDQHQRTVERTYRNYLGLLWAVRAGKVEAEEMEKATIRLRVEGLEMVAVFDEASGRLLEISMPGLSLAGVPVTEKRAFSKFDVETGLPMKVDVFHDDALSAEITIKDWKLGVSSPEGFFDRPENTGAEP